MAAFLGVAVFLSCGVADASVASSVPAEVASVGLEYQEVSFSVMNWSVSVTSRPAPFKREPAAARGKVIRGALQFGRHDSDSIPFLWQRGAGKLLLDLNRNQDLTDDVAGVFAARERTPEIFQTFAGVRLPFPTQTSVRQVLADLTLRDYGSRPSASAALRSCWQGKLILQGVEWQAGMVREPLGKFNLLQGSHILLRPWDERDQPFSVDTGSLAVLPFSRSVFIRDRAYQLHCETGPGDAFTQVRLQFTERTAALGKVNVAGAFVQRILLEGGPYLVVIDKPEGPVRVPAGLYTGHKVWLKTGKAEAYRKAASLPSGARIVVDANQMTTLSAGGPLTNAVSVQRRGQNLQLSYQLVGAGGQPYQLGGLDRARQPEFTVYQDGRQIASGKFQFG